MSTMGLGSKINKHQFKKDPILADPFCVTINLPNQGEQDTQSPDNQKGIEIKWVLHFLVLIE